MTKLFLPVGLMLSLNGCATAAVALACSTPSMCGPLGEAAATVIAIEVDKAIIGEVIEDLREEDTWHQVHLEGVVTVDGAPVSRAMAELRADDAFLGRVHTDESGRYELHEVAEGGSCYELGVVFSHPDLGRTDRIRLACGDARIDHDFGPATASDADR